MKLSVIIVNYNVAYFLEQCLKSIQKAVLLAEEHYEKNCIEIIVVDNQSIDGSVEMLKELFQDVKLIANKQNVGFSKANNQAISIAQGEYILLLNPDTVIEDDTLLHMIRFMDQTPDAGGLGVKMVDGKGRFLPESKRGLPTPWVAFYKIFGLSSLFPRSKRFGRYHLGYLSPNQIHAVDILSGACMMLRKNLLDKIGYLDEDFFMYGEDIDLSYRIILAGYKNYYYPNTRIIHYKGESTKKSSVNYVFVFYNAMIIFAHKHFQKGNAGIFSLLIRIAIYLRATLAILQRIIHSIAFPMLDATIAYSAMLGLKIYWEQNHKYIEGGSYPSVFSYILLPAYVLIWIIGVYMNGGYVKPYKSYRIFRGVIIGTLIILVVYGLLPESLRFSRAIILIGSALVLIILLLTRIISHFLRHKNISFEQGRRKRLIIAGSEDECKRIEGVIRSTHSTADIIGYVLPITPDSITHPIIGHLSQLTDLVHIYNVQEIIFCGKDIPSSVIIDQMSLISDSDIDFKIAPPASEFIIGSNSIHRTGELYVLDLNAIHKTANRRNKRLLDISISFLLILFSPIIMFCLKNPIIFLKNSFSVLIGKCSWVGYSDTYNGQTNMRLPKIRKGVLNPSDATNIPVHEAGTLVYLDMLYAKDYNPSIDLTIILKNISKLDRSMG